MSSTDYKQLLDEAWDLHVAKNAGYAGANNPDPWANFRMSEAFGVSALDGCLVRMSDKYIRVTNLRRSADNERVGESLRDTLRDLAAYANIAVCLLDEQAKKAAVVRTPAPTQAPGTPAKPKLPYNKRNNTYWSQFDKKAKAASTASSPAQAK